MPLHTKRPFTYPLWIYLSCSLLFLVVLSLAQLAIPTWLALFLGCHRHSFYALSCKLKKFIKPTQN